jgi:RNA polymerase sigma-70 factor (ECF subfamily)
MTTAALATPFATGPESGALGVALDFPQDAPDDGPSREANSASDSSATRPSDAARDAEFARDALPWLDDVYRFALSLTREEADADDVVQETFLRAYRSWHTFIPGTDCRRWLFTICRNVFLRSRERQRPTVDLEDGEQDAVAAGSVYAAAREKGYDDLYARLDLAPALRDALDELAEPFRSAVILVDVEDMTYESAAEVMGVPIGTVRSRLFRGRRLLQEKLLTVAADLGFVPASAGGAT